MPPLVARGHAIKLFALLVCAQPHSQSCTCTEARAVKLIKMLAVGFVRHIVDVHIDDRIRVDLILTEEIEHGVSVGVTGDVAIRVFDEARLGADEARASAGHKLLVKRSEA